jgi:FtsP/CotA-like multicopper oxidase with cupredoxin domain
MTDNSSGPRLNRRRLLQAGGLTAGLAAVRWATGAPPAAGMRPVRAAATIPEQTLSPDARIVELAATDGWIYIPGTATYHPDPLAPEPQTTWGFGFRDVTGLTDTQIKAQAGHFQNAAPVLWADEGEELVVKLHNLGLTVRPDLTDSHTIHWHGFRNATPLFDGVPELSVAVPIGRQFGYYYKPEDPGTYMYHCHFEDVEHVSMGMSGVVFVRPAQNAGDGTIPPGKYCYNDGVMPETEQSTAYDREYAMFLAELWTQERWEGAHVQEHDWSEYHADVWLLNGRSYPDTLAPPGSRAADGNLVAPSGHPELQYQPTSSLIEANAGDRILLRFVNLGFEQQAMSLQGPPMKVVGLDATALVGRDGTDNTYYTDTIQVGPGESADCIFTCPPVTELTTFLLANRSYAHLHNPGIAGLGGQLTEVRVHPSGVPDQTEPNH